MLILKQRQLRRNGCKQVQTTEHEKCSQANVGESVPCKKRKNPTRMEAVQTERDTLEEIRNSAMGRRRKKKMRSTNDLYASTPKVETKYEEEVFGVCVKEDVPGLEPGMSVQPQGIYRTHALQEVRLASGTGISESYSENGIATIELSEIFNDCEGETDHLSFKEEASAVVMPWLDLQGKATKPRSWISIISCHSQPETTTIPDVASQVNSEPKTLVSHGKGGELESGHIGDKLVPALQPWDWKRVSDCSCSELATLHEVSSQTVMEVKESKEVAQLESNSANVKLKELIGEKNGELERGLAEDAHDYSTQIGNLQLADCSSPEPAILSNESAHTSLEVKCFLTHEVESEFELSQDVSLPGNWKSLVKVRTPPDRATHHDVSPQTDGECKELILSGGRDQLEPIPETRKDAIKSSVSELTAISLQETATSADVVLQPKTQLRGSHYVRKEGRNLEMRDWGQPGGIDTEKLTVVPWLDIEAQCQTSTLWHASSQTNSEPQNFILDGGEVGELDSLLHEKLLVAAPQPWDWNLGVPDCRLPDSATLPEVSLQAAMELRKSLLSGKEIGQPESNSEKESPGDIVSHTFCLPETATLPGLPSPQTDMGRKECQLIGEDSGKLGLSPLKEPQDDFTQIGNLRLTHCSQPVTATLSNESENRCLDAKRILNHEVINWKCMVTSPPDVSPQTHGEHKESVLSGEGGRLELMSVEESGDDIMQRGKSGISQMPDKSLPEIENRGHVAMQGHTQLKWSPELRQERKLEISDHSPAGGIGSVRQRLNIHIHKDMLQELEIERGMKRCKMTVEPLNGSSAFQSQSSDREVGVSSALGRSTLAVTTKGEHERCVSESSGEEAGDWETTRMKRMTEAKSEGDTIDLSFELDFKGRKNVSQTANEERIEIRRETLILTEDVSVPQVPRDDILIGKQKFGRIDNVPRGEVSPREEVSPVGSIQGNLFDGVELIAPQPSLFRKSISVEEGFCGAVIDRPPVSTKRIEPGNGNVPTGSVGTGACLQFRQKDGNQNFCYHYVMTWTLRPKTYSDAFSRDPASGEREGGSQGEQVNAGFQAQTKQEAEAGNSETTCCTKGIEEQLKHLRLLGDEGAESLITSTSQEELVVDEWSSLLESKEVGGAQNIGSRESPETDARDLVCNNSKATLAVCQEQMDVPISQMPSQEEENAMVHGGEKTHDMAETDSTMETDPKMEPFRVSQTDGMVKELTENETDDIYESNRTPDFDRPVETVESDDMKDNSETDCRAETHDGGGVDDMVETTGALRLSKTGNSGEANCLQSSVRNFTTLHRKGLLSVESLEVEEDTRHEIHSFEGTSKMPCNRKAISPRSQIQLLQAFHSQSPMQGTHCFHLKPPNNHSKDPCGGTLGQSQSRKAAQRWLKEQSCRHQDADTALSDLFEHMKEEGQKESDSELLSHTSLAFPSSDQQAVQSNPSVPLLHLSSPLRPAESWPPTSDSGSLPESSPRANCCGHPASGHIEHTSLPRKSGLQQTLLLCSEESPTPPLQCTSYEYPGKSSTPCLPILQPARNRPPTGFSNGNCSGHPASGSSDHNQQPPLPRKPGLQQALLLCTEELPIPSPAPLKSILKTNAVPCSECPRCLIRSEQAKTAAEFINSQMHYIKRVAERLMGELGCLCNLVKDQLLPHPGVVSLMPVTTCTPKVRGAINGAVQAERWAHKELKKMARDSRQMCHIIGMGPRRITFADEVGRQLCHVKYFQSQRTWED